jgi:signal transduction histidine kinase/ActR/RegA family two-component response regulator
MVIGNMTEAAAKEAALGDRQSSSTPAVRGRWKDFFQLRRQRLFYRAATVQVVVSLVWSLVQFAYRNWFLGIFIGLEGLLSLLVVLNFKRFRNPEVAIALTTILLIWVVGGTNFFGGGLAGGNASMFLLIPVGAVALGGHRGLWWMFPTVILVGIMGLLHYAGYEYPNTIPPQVERVDAFLTWMTTIAVVSFLIVMYHNTSQRTAEELRQASRKLEQAAENKSRFVAHISHELRTPLHGLLGLIEIMEEEPDAARRQHMVEQALRNSSILLGLLGDLQDLSLVEAGTLALRRERFLLRQALELVAGMIRPRAEKKGLEFLLRLDPGAPQWLLADPLRLQQLLVNLLSNAVKYTDKGKVELSVDVREREGSRVRLRFSVKDSGVGISEADRERIFEPFYRGQEALRHGEGTGLGLPICRKLVQLMGGRLELESTVGSGSEFFFELDMETALPPSDLKRAAAGAEENEPRLNGCRILVVEDDQINRRLAELMLRSLGCVVTAVESGKDALAAARHNDFQCVLMDLQMPQMNGLETAAELARYWRSQGKNCPPVIIMTAYKLNDQHQLARQGIAKILEKPFSLEKLQLALSDSLRRKEAAS